MKENHLFQEKQNLFVGQKLFLSSIVLITLVGAFMPLINGSTPLPVATMSVPLLVVFGIGLINLHTKIDSNNIYIRFFPFVLNKTINFSDIKDVHLRKYSPLWEYGGWGFRGSSKNRAYNISGKWGLQIVFKNGNRLLIGTKKHTTLEKVLRDIKSKRGEELND